MGCAIWDMGWGIWDPKSHITYLTNPSLLEVKSIGDK